MSGDREVHLEVLDLNGTAGENSSAVYVRQVAITCGDEFGPGGIWSVGPLPLVQPRTASSGQRDSARVTDEAARRTLVAEAQSDVLYGNQRRFHRALTTKELSGGVFALELLVPEGLKPHSEGNGLLAVHVAGHSTGDLVALSRPLSADGVRAWEAVERLLGRALTTFGAVRSLHHEQLVAGVEEVRTRAYARVVGSTNVTSDDLAARAGRHPLTIERPDWSALVLRDGAAFVAHQRSSESFGPTLRILVHSVYLDAMLLAWLQRHLIDRSARLAARAGLEGSRDLVELEKEHFDFKRTYWRRSLTHKRTSPTDEVFKAFQDELLTPADVEDVEGRVRDGARLARTLQAEEAEEARDQLARLVRNATVVVGSMTLAFTAAPVLTEPGVGAFAGAVAAGLAGIGVAFAAIWAHGQRR